MRRNIWYVGSVVLLGGCYSSFVRNDGPVQGGGVAVALVGQRCDYSPDFNVPEEAGVVPNRLDLGISVTIENNGQDAIVVQPENLRLVVAGAQTAPVSPPDHVEVPPGAKRKFSLRFRRQGDVGCNSNLSLALDKVVLTGTRPVELRPVSFVPSTTEG